MTYRATDILKNKIHLNGCIGHSRLTLLHVSLTQINLVHVFSWLQNDKVSFKKPGGRTTYRCFFSADVESPHF